MVNVSLSQDELKTLISIINHAFTKGGLNVADAAVLLPIFGKLDGYIEKPNGEATKEIIAPKN